MANVTIDVAAQFKGKPAFDKAGNAVSGLEKTVGKLAKQFTGLFAVNKVIAFGKASLKAFEEDQKSAAMLANTMKNLGMQFATPVLESYIANLSKTAAVADDELRPAMQKLLTQTGNYVKSQELLNQAIEVSRGSGVDLATVTQDLANAYIGNTKGLKKYNLGLTQAQLKTMKFTDIQKKLTTQFKGSNAAYLKTYAGQMQVLNVAAGEAKETIGKGLIDSLGLLAGDGSVQGLADAMQSFADFTSNSIYAVASLASELKNLKAAAPSWLQSLFNVTSNVGPLGQIKQGIKGLQAIANYGERQRNKTLENPSTLMFKKDEANNRLNNMQYKAYKQQEKAAKALTAEQKKQAMLKKQGSIFDLEQIQLVAALKGKLSDEERDRVKLQLALLTGNTEEATRLTAKIAAAQDATGQLAAYLKAMPDAKNPFAAWQGYLETIKLTLSQIISLSPVSGNGSTARGKDFADLSNTSQGLITGAMQGQAGVSKGGDVYVTVQGSVVSQQELIDAVQNGLQLQSLAGSPSVIGRIAGMFG